MSPEQIEALANAASAAVQIDIAPAHRPGVLHYFGLFFGQLLGLYLSYAVVWWAALIVCPASYFVAYLSHEWVEGNSNKPYATRPAWSVVSFFRMLALDLTGQLHRQTARLTPAARASDAAPFRC